MIDISIQRAIARIEREKQLEREKAAATPPPKSDLQALQDLAPLARAVAYAAEILPRLEALEAENAKLKDESLLRKIEAGRQVAPPTPAEAEYDGPIEIRVDRNGEGRLTVLTVSTPEGDLGAYRVQRDGTGKVSVLLEGEEPKFFVVRDHLGRIKSITSERP